jgi:two-component system sensor histidine kinase/response regulator
LAVGLLASGLLFALLRQMAGTRRRALALAETMTVAVRASEAKLRSALEAMESARDLALAGSRAKSDFLATMSHEVRTPLNGIIGLTDLLGDSVSSETQRDLVQNLRTCGRSLLTLINDILDFSKIEAGKIELERVRFEPTQLITTARTLLDESVRQKRLAWAVRIDPGLPAAFEGDPGRIQQVLLNLMSNAVKFTEAGTITVGLAGVGAPPDRGAWRVRFEVEDTGIGIPPAAQERLFTAFTQADSSTTRRYGGTGLGLAICKRLVELMGGSIGLSSSEGRGSKFFFELPLHAVASAGVVTSTARQTRVSAGGTQPRILLIEDDPIDQKVIGALLKKRDFAVDLASNGPEGLRALEAHDYDLILLACQLPDLGGDATSALVHRRAHAGHRTPIVALASSSGDDVRARCQAAGFDDLVGKPIDKLQLIEAVERLVGAG